MGGFVGFFDDKSIDEKNNIIKQMNDKIKHRGPDSESFFADDKFAAGSRDLCYENENYAIFFNGRIYNSQEIIPDTSSDAEVVLRGYEKYGENIASILRGMFSFVIYNKTTHDLYGARDHFGSKWIYYYLNNNLFMFGSEIKSFLPHPDFRKELNKNVLKLYLIFQYSPTEETFFKNVYKLPQGCYFTYKNGEFKSTRYFDINYNTENKPFDEYVKILDETLKKSVEFHQIGCADGNVGYEIGSFLSGGVDSSFITSVAKPKKTFSVGFALDGFDESMYAKELSDILHIDNYKKIVSSDEFFDALPFVQYHSDEPHANLSSVPLYFLAKLASEHVKVVLSGEGSDEFFAGYLPYAESGFTKFYSKWPFGCRKFIKNIVKSLPNFKGKAMLIKYGQKVEDYFIGQAFIMNDDEANDILSDGCKSNVSYKDVTAPYFEKVKDKSDLIKKLYLDLFLWMPNDILLKGDKMSAAYNLEVRTPIMDKEVFALASKIPTKYFIKNKSTKYLFRQVANKVIPEEWAKRKKLGFPVPFTLWLREQKYYDMLKNMFNEDFVSEFFVKDKLLTMLDEHFKNVKNNGRKLYTVYSFLVWYKVYFVEGIN
jgi:asparagine synthase (glutamine-hydrolysing)